MSRASAQTRSRGFLCGSDTMNARDVLPRPSSSTEGRGAPHSNPTAAGRGVGDQGKPWHKHSWPWLLMVAPALSIVGGVAMMWLALASNDGLVADDYYKQGLAINQTLARERAAAASGLRARVTFGADFAGVRVVLTGTSGSSVLALRLVHPTRVGFDRVVMLHSVGGGVYDGALERPAFGHWNVLLEDGARTWRLWGALRIPSDSALTLESR